MVHQKLACFSHVEVEGFAFLRQDEEETPFAYWIVIGVSGLVTVVLFLLILSRGWV